MSQIPLARRVVALLLVLAVTIPLAAAAAAHRSDPKSAEGLSTAAAPITQLWSWLTSLWEKNGCGIDPNGRCLPGTGAPPAPPTGTDNGCMIDPSGRCRS